MPYKTKDAKRDLICKTVQREDWGNLQKEAHPNVKELLRYINRTPELLSLLYDLDLLPEQLERDSFQWQQMLILSNWHHRTIGRQPLAAVSESTCDECGGPMPQAYESYGQHHCAKCAGVN